MIVLEGMDNSGKTTFAKYLSDKLGIVYQHSEKPKDVTSVISDTISSCMITAPQVIRDRISPISEMVYGPVIRKESIMEGHQWSLLDLICKTDNLIIYCRPPTANILNFGEREQMEGVIDHSGELLRRYDWVFKVLSFRYPKKIIRYNYNAPNSHKDKVVNLCFNFLQENVCYQNKLQILEDQWQTLYDKSIHLGEH